MARRLSGLVLDSGSLIAAERNDRRFWALWKAALLRDLDVRIPATVLAQAWRGGRQARMALVIKACAIDALGDAVARRSGELCADAGTSDVVDAHVVVTASALGHDVVTSEPDDLRHLMGFVSRPTRVLDLRRLPEA